MLSWLSVLVCVYSFGLCFKDHNPEGAPAAQQACHCCACPVDCGEESAAPGASSCRHQHGHDGFHLHKMVPVLLQQQEDGSPVKAGRNACSPAAVLTAAVSGTYSGGKPAVPPPVFLPASRILPGQTLPLLL